MIGQIVKVIVDRPLGSCHPYYKNMTYPINYGYIENIMAADGEEQDAYILGLWEPVTEFIGKVIAIIHRFDDIEEKWVVAPENMIFTKEEILKSVNFQEQYFNIVIQTNLE
ncbi:inorganic pyrophosphatase [Fusobacterium necrophorum subsp. funduliforme]|uniref:inorganic diphosphatase n=2 Tax=Fusobacterium necrophorum TaxID=859 RepID=A0AAN4AT81_9FUSO|nr:inorganic diphosphatase [Fusobacterium necrophorum]AYV94882.1 inorganic pyrophosphatase [Fusobacterium necrophorum subsp. funduliforme]EJU17907.1 inorganic diphosphatase-like protein [Fusobacterium necrophorum subsp. funduliforme Fnf 1007]KYK99983.1 inorganic pyrophosphatase [Fusobacterium necrophorum subsp. funduliforme]KYL02287.1 inorganic pyrophosphatase [Fusobacterium necrophorum subsp. funduliforme]KYM37408.1 inorganic pyrophosphatase [Fusobacterium necrophorum subsp. funduliforme]